MAKKQVKKVTKRKVVKAKKTFIEYNSLTFVLFLVFVLIVSVLLVAKMVN
ncbi:MAG: hypothetical protein AAB532_01475 [Patescibacteria group bacterium]